MFQFNSSPLLSHSCSIKPQTMRRSHNNRMGVIPALKCVGSASMCGKTKAIFVYIGDVYSNMYSRNRHKMLLCFPAGRLKDNVFFIVVEEAESIYTTSRLRRAISLPMKSLSTESNCSSLEITDADCGQVQNERTSMKLNFLFCL